MRTISHTEKLLRKIAAAQDTSIRELRAIPTLDLEAAMRDHAQKSNPKTALMNRLGESLGVGTSTVIGGILGNLMGQAVGSARGAASWEKPMYGASGMAFGIAIPLLAATALAAIRRRRTQQEQLEHDADENIAANFLVPGAALYNKLKRLGRIREEGTGV